METRFQARGKKKGFLLQCPEAVLELAKAKARQRMPPVTTSLYIVEAIEKRLAADESGTPA